MEGGGDLRVHLDHEILLDGHLGIPFLYAILDPTREHAFEDSGADVADPLFSDLVNLNRIWHVLEDLLMGVAEEGGDVLDG